MKYCGKERGSITLFLALILSLLLSLVCTSIESVRMASARTQILNSMDIGLMSTLKEEIVRYLFWERIMRIILQKNIIMQ